MLSITFDKRHPTKPDFCRLEPSIVSDVGRIRGFLSYESGPRFFWLLSDVGSLFSCACGSDFSAEWHNKGNNFHVRLV